MAARGPTLEFWYEFASTYSYLSAMRIEALATAAGVAVEWKPFLLGPIFKAQGWDTSPFNLYPAKGRYMMRDLERLTAERGLRFARPLFHRTLVAARRPLVGGDEGLDRALHACSLCRRVRRARGHVRCRRAAVHPRWLTP